MAQGKVEICGVNTAKLPVLKEAEKQAYNIHKQQLFREAYPCAVIIPIMRC